MAIPASCLVAEETNSRRVTVDNFVRAETDMYFGRFVNEGGFGKFKHDRELASIDNQTVIRLNRDTLYSFGVFDLDASPVIVTLPDAGKRFMALMVINQDHYVPEVVYAPGRHTFTREKVGTRYVAFAVRTFVNPDDAADVNAVHALQDAIKTEQKQLGKFVAPTWDPVSHKRMRDALLGVVEANGELNSARMFGSKEEVDPVEHLLGTAAGWGGNPRADAFYSGATPAENDGKTPYVLVLKDVPVDGFWSVSVYNKEGYFEKNALGAYSLNNITAKAATDGTVTIRFGGDEKGTNYLPIEPGWNYLLRFYRPRRTLLDGEWKIPLAEPVK
ncbi:DUF1214 domain-containing protein [Caulifigura coniformis]